MEFILDGTCIHTEIDLHRVLSEAFEFGPYYGRNLAALRDRLATDVERPVKIVWKNSEASRHQLGDDLFNKITEIFDFVADQDASFGWEDRFGYVLE
jgi:ribonuclease inhibitor